jgi:hypothetical protein
MKHESIEKLNNGAVHLSIDLNQTENRRIGCEVLENLWARFFERQFSNEYRRLKKDMDSGAGISDLAVLTDTFWIKVGMTSMEFNVSKKDNFYRRLFSGLAKTFLRERWHFFPRCPDLNFPWTIASSFLDIKTRIVDSLTIGDCDCFGVPEAMYKSSMRHKKFYLFSMIAKKSFVLDNFIELRLFGFIETDRFWQDSRKVKAGTVDRGGYYTVNSNLISGSQLRGIYHAD